MSLADSLHLPADPRKRQLVIFGSAGALLGVVVIVRRRSSKAAAPAGATLVSSGDAGSAGTTTTGTLGDLGSSSTGSDLTATNDLLTQMLATLQTTAGGTSTVSTGADQTGGAVVTTGSGAAAAAGGGDTGSAIVAVPAPTFVPIPTGAAAPGEQGPGNAPINPSAVPLWAQTPSPTTPQAGPGGVAAGPAYLPTKTVAADSKKGKVHAA